jgi:hypothetical protein
VSLNLSFYYFFQDSINNYLGLDSFQENQNQCKFNFSIFQFYNWRFSEYCKKSSTSKKVTVTLGFQTKKGWTILTMWVFFNTCHLFLLSYLFISAKTSYQKIFKWWVFFVLFCFLNYYHKQFIKIVAWVVWVRPLRNLPNHILALKTQPSTFFRRLKSLSSANC